jgi:hypothetical protein
MTYEPGLHLFNWAMSDYPLYLRVKDLSAMIKGGKNSTATIEGVAAGIARDSARNASKLGEYDLSILSAEEQALAIQTAAELILNEAREKINEDAISSIDWRRFPM